MTSSIGPPLRAATSSVSARRSAILKRANGFKSIFGAIRVFDSEPRTPGMNQDVAQ